MYYRKIFLLKLGWLDFFFVNFKTNTRSNLVIYFNNFLFVSVLVQCFLFSLSFVKFVVQDHDTCAY